MHACLGVTLHSAWCAAACAACNRSVLFNSIMGGTEPGSSSAAGRPVSAHSAKDGQSGLPLLAEEDSGTSSGGGGSVRGVARVRELSQVLKEGPESTRTLEAMKSMDRSLNRSLTNVRAWRQLWLG